MGLGGLAAGKVKPRRFAAFISYAHADAAIAAKLQSRLERYRLPKHLAESFAGGQTALGQIFRDREDLAAAPSLSDAIHAAIAEAEALIVICSPEAAASRWVGEEIALFRRLHPGKPILAAVVRGEPEQAFPTALTEGGNEPLAADLRKEGDGEALGFLKIVAGIAAVPLDALVQRDAQRRIRRVMWITGAAFAAMLVMGVMTTLALAARNEAARQRESAEGLVEYMLTDLRDKLKGVGRLDVMEGVNARAKAYYGRKSFKGKLLEAQVLRAMGEDFDRKGDADKALDHFRRADNKTEALLNAYPENTDAVFAHAQSKYWIGYSAYTQGNFINASKSWESYRSLVQKLIKADPKRPEWQQESGYAEGNICTLELERNDRIGNPLPFCTSALNRMIVVQRMLPGDPQNLLNVINRYAWLAEAYEKAQNNLKELKQREKASNLAQRLVTIDLKNADYRDMQISTLIALAECQFRNSQRSAALATIRRAHSLNSSLIALDPSNQRWGNYQKPIEIMLNK